MVAKIIFKLLTDVDTIRGFVGTAMAIVLPFIKILTPIFQFSGAVLGVILVLYSIKHKQIQIKNEKNSKP